MAHEVSALEAGLGTLAGHLAPTSYQPPSPTHAVVLGSDLPGQWALLADGDYVEVSQTGSFANVDIVRVTVELEGRSAPPDDGAWRFGVYFDGVERIGVDIEPGSKRTYVDLAVDVADLNAGYALSYRLTFSGANHEAYHVELPAARIDNVILIDAVEEIALFNRLPEPGHDRVPVNTDIQLDIGELIANAAGNPLSISPNSVWRFDEPSGTTAADAVGAVNGTHGSAVSPGQAGQIGLTARYTNFSSSDNYTTFGDVYGFERTDTFSVSIWFRTISSSYMTLIGKMQSFSPFRGWQVVFENGNRIRVFLVNSWASNWISVHADQANLNDNAWHHIVFTYDGSSQASGVKIYIDGVQKAVTPNANALNATIVTNTSHLMTGAIGTPAQSMERFLGFLDEPAIFVGGQLTAQDVADIYAAGAAGDSLVDLVAGTPSLVPVVADTQVFVDGVLAFDGGVFQTGFDGPNSAFSNPQPDVLRIVIDPTSALADGEVHTVQVVSQITSLIALNQSYQFTTEDLTGPIIVMAEGVGLRRVRVTFDEHMASNSPNATGDATNPNTYALALVTGTAQTRLPAVRGEDVGIESVERVGSTVFDLKLDIETTPRALYIVEATANDVWGNEGTSSAEFVGYQPTVDSEREYDYLRWLPTFNIAEDTTQDLTNFVRCLQEVGELLLYESDAFPDILDPDFAPEQFVDAMLVDLGYPFHFDLNASAKRRIVKVLRAMYQQKGTDTGIINAIRLFLGIEVTITTPYKTNSYLGLSYLGVDLVLATSVLADLYTFVVHVPFQPTAEQLLRMNRIIDYMKRAPCHWRIEAPSYPSEPDHWALGFSKLGVESYLH